MSVNKEYIDARIREINDAIQMLRELTTKDFEELTIYERLSSAARLRNLLVHRYWMIVDEKVYESVKCGLKDFERFILYIKKLPKDPISNENMDVVKEELKYYRLTEEEKLKLLGFLRERLECDSGILFAYVHGGFIERCVFRDVDVALWIENVEKAFYYTVDFSVKMEVDVGIPIDVQVLNQAPLPFKYYVFTRGELLFSRDEKLRFEVVNETMRKYFDLKMLREEAC